MGIQVARVVGYLFTQPIGVIEDGAVFGDFNLSQQESGIGAVKDIDLPGESVAGGQVMAGFFDDATAGDLSEKLLRLGARDRKLEFCSFGCRESSLDADFSVFPISDTDADRDIIFTGQVALHEMQAVDCGGERSAVDEELVFDFSAHELNWGRRFFLAEDCWSA